MANDIPLISRRGSSPITSAGTGSTGLGDIRYKTSETPDLTGAGGALGAFVGAMTALRGSGRGDPNASKNISAAQRAINELNTPKEVGGGGSGSKYDGNSGELFKPEGGFPERFGNVYPENISSVVNELITLPPYVKTNMEAQDYVDKQYGTVNGKSRYVVAGIADPNTNTIVATPNYNIGPDFNNFQRGTSDLFENGGEDPTKFLDSTTDEATTMPYDFGNDITSDQVTDMLGGGGGQPVIDISGFGSEDYMDSEVFDFMPDFDTGSWLDSVGDYLSDFGSNVYDFFDFSDFDWFKDGGRVRGYEGGGEVKTSVSDVLPGAGVGAGLGALLGYLLSGRSQGNVSQGVDMSKVGVINPRTTNFGMGPTPYVPFSQYSPRTPTAQPNYQEILKNLGISTGFADGGSTSYYTYGTPVDAKEILRGGNMAVPMMAKGGLPKATAPMTMSGRHDYRHGQYVDGIGDGQSDEIPAMLADGEYVIDSDTVAALGNGSNKAGAKLLDGMRKEVRAHKRSAPVDKIPPKAKSPLEYMRMGAMKKGAK